MGQRVPLPKYTALPSAVLFHRKHPADPQIILQIPNEDRTGTLASHVLYTDREGDYAWLANLLNGRALLDKLKGELHVAYYPADGHIQAIKDLDMPGEFASVVADARTLARSPFFDRQHSMARRARVNIAPVSSLRRWLGGKLR